MDDRRIIKNFLIDNDGKLYHTRGDTATFSIDIECDGLPIEEYSATFSVKQYPDDDSYLYQKEFNHNSPCVINHSDTIGIPYGTYWWDIQVVFQMYYGLQYRTVGAYPYILLPDVTT